MSWLPTSSTSSTSTDPTGMLGGLLSGGVTSWIGSITGILGGLGLSGPTGNAKVHFYNERNSGPQWWYGKDVGAVYNTFEAMFNQLGTSLTQFGWGELEVPREATADFKNAENYFFNNIDNYLEKVARGDATPVERLFGDSDVQRRYEQIQNGLMTNPNTNTSGTEANNGAQNSTMSLLNMKFAGFPIWAVGIAVYLLMKKR